MRNDRTAASRVRGAIATAASLIVAGSVMVACAPDAGPVAAPLSPSSVSATATPRPTPRPSTTPLPTDAVQPDPTPSAGTPVAVLIVNYGADGGSVYASGIVTGDTSADGTCTLTATSSAGDSSEGSTGAQATPEAVNCGTITIAVPAGDWELVLAYSSATVDATSEPVEVTRP